MKNPSLVQLIIASSASKKIAISLGLAVTTAFASAQGAGVCSATSGLGINPVIELYTSEGCSSCPPADRWLSKLKTTPSQAVVQAFHVGYWDYIGWVDRFAVPSHTQRQRQIAAANGLSSIYTPQLVKDGQDWRAWVFASQNTVLQPAGSAKLAISLSRDAQGQVQAQVVPTAPGDAGLSWSAYWSVTEHAHASRVNAGENKGEHLLHDHVVRQYTPVGQYSGAQTLRFVPIAASVGHPQRVNLVLHEPKTGKTLQALSLACG